METGTHGADGNSRDGEAGPRRGTSGAGELHMCDTRATHTATTMRGTAKDGKNEEDGGGRQQGEGDV